MGVKVEWGGDKENEIKYPCLMRSKDSGCIVLFTERETGVCLYEGRSNICFIGEHYNKWNVNYFEPFNGTLTLSNEE